MVFQTREAPSSAVDVMLPHLQRMIPRKEESRPRKGFGGSNCGIRGYLFTAATHTTMSLPLLSLRSE